MLYDEDHARKNWMIAGLVLVILGLLAFYLEMTFGFMWMRIALVVTCVAAGFVGGSYHRRFMT